MEAKFDRLKSFVQNLGYEVASENYDEQIILISDESKGIVNLVIDIEDPIVIFEQLIGTIREESVLIRVCLCFSTFLSSQKRKNERKIIFTTMSARRRRTTNNTTICSRNHTSLGLFYL